MASSNLRDGNVLQDFSVWINGEGKLGTCPNFQTPELKIQTEEFRGGGMDGTVEMPFGIEKIEFDFEMHTWDPQIFKLLGYGPGSLDVPVNFRGYIMTPADGSNFVGGDAQGPAFNPMQRPGTNTSEMGVLIETRSLIKEIKAGKSEPGKKTSITVSLVANYYKHTIGNETVTEIDVFNKITKIGGVDRSAAARRFLGLNY